MARMVRVALLLVALTCLVVGSASASSTSTGFTVWLSGDNTIPPTDKIETKVLSTTLPLVAGESRRISDRLGVALSGSDSAAVGNHILCLDPSGKNVAETSSGTNQRGSSTAELGLMESVLLKASLNGTYTCQIWTKTSDESNTKYSMSAVDGAPPFLTTGTWLRISSSDEVGSHAWSNHECNSPGTFPTCVYLGDSSSPRVAHLFSGPDGDRWTAATDTTEVDVIGTFQITSCPNGTSSCTSPHWGDSGFLGTPLGEDGFAEFQSYLELNQLNPDGSLCQTNRSDDDASPSGANDLGHSRYYLADSVHHLPVSYHLNATVSPNCNGSRTFVLDYYVGWEQGNPIKLDNGGFNVIQSVHGAATTMVPPVIGLNEAQAVTAIRARALQPLTIKRAMNPATVGSVFAQNSPGGTVEPTGSEVDLSVSLGQTAVPNLLGSNESTAVHAIAAAGLAVGQISSVNSCLDPGLVQLQNPTNGTLVTPGTSVSFTIATCTSGGGDDPPVHPK